MALQVYLLLSFYFGCVNKLLKGCNHSAIQPYNVWIPALIVE